MNVSNRPLPSKRWIGPSFVASKANAAWQMTFYGRFADGLRGVRLPKINNAYWLSYFTTFKKINLAIYLLLVEHDHHLFRNSTCFWFGSHFPLSRQSVDIVIEVAVDFQRMAGKKQLFQS